MPRKLSSSSKLHHFTESSWKLQQVQLRKKWEFIAKVNSVGEIWWRPLELKTFQKWKKIWKRKRTNSNHVRYRNRHKQSQAKALVLLAILNTWLPRCRSNFIYSNNTLLKAGCCKSELRYLKHWYRLLCPGLVKPIIGHSFGKSWYMSRFSILREHLFF